MPNLKTTQKPRIFFSYSRDDGDFVLKLAQAQAKRKAEEEAQPRTEEKERQRAVAEEQMRAQAAYRRGFSAGARFPSPATRSSHEYSLAPAGAAAPTLTHPENTG